MRLTPNRKRVIHSNLLLPCPFPRYEVTPVTTRQSVVVKREQSTKKDKPEDIFALTVSEFKAPHDYEDDLPTLLPSQLDQVCSQESMWRPSASVGNEELSISSPQTVCEENQDSTNVPMTYGNPESQEMLQIPDSIEPDEDVSSRLESTPQLSKRPPNVLSYCRLGTSQDSHPGIYSISPQSIPICTGSIR